MSAALGIPEQVAAGAAFMDEADPGWWREDVERAIDLDRLDLGDPAICVLGQRCPLEALNAYATSYGVSPYDDGRYWAFARQISGIGFGCHDDDDVFDWAIERGFATPDLGDFGALTAEWKRVITERRAGAQ